MEFPLTEIEVVNIRVLETPNPLDTYVEGRVPSEKETEPVSGQMMRIVPLHGDRGAVDRDEVELLVGQAWGGHSVVATSVETAHFGADGPVTLNIVVALLGSGGAGFSFALCESLARLILSKLRDSAQSAADMHEVFGDAQAARFRVAELLDCRVEDLALESASQMPNTEEYVFRKLSTGTLYRITVSAQGASLRREAAGGAS